MTTSIESADGTAYLEVVRGHLKLLSPEAPVPTDVSLESLGLDSASALNLMLDLEERFGVVFDESLFTEETFATAQSLWDALVKLRHG
jgi:acyl carrier protein